MLFIASAMLLLIVASVIADVALPERLKERLGVVICWSMMAVTMAFLTLSAVGLIFILAFQVVPKLLA